VEKKTVTITATHDMLKSMSVASLYSRTKSLKHPLLHLIIWSICNWDE